MSVFREPGPISRPSICCRQQLERAQQNTIYFQEVPQGATEHFADLSMVRINKIDACPQAGAASFFATT
jgi:hypothetical protein